jgi:uncharacterized protein (TIGR02145 family)
MKNTALLVFILSFLLVSCGDDSGNSADDSETITNKTVSGVVQFGPFEKGATVAVYELDEKFQKTGINYENEIENEKGEYSINVKELKSRYALLKANGYFHSYITDKKSIDKIALYALADLGDHSEVNINILTHLSHKRAIYLATEKKLPLADAEKQAEKEVLKSFDIDEIFDSTENWNIFGNKDKNAALLALSILMQSVFLKGNIDKILDDIVLDFEKDGSWDDKKTKTLIADFAYKTFEETRFSAINDNIKKSHPSTDIPPFEKYINNFWWQNYGLGSCEGKRKNEVKKNQNSGSDYSKKLFICRPDIWRGASEREILNDSLTRLKGNDGDITLALKVCFVYENNSWNERDISNCTLGLKGCTEQRQGELGLTANNKWFICDNKIWVSDITCEDDRPTKTIKFKEDTVGWKDTTEGAIRKGKTTDVIYIFDKKNWRVATLPEASLGGCTKKIQDSVGYAPMREEQDYIDSQECYNAIFTPGYYKCNDLHWEKADKCAFGLSRWKNSKEGDFHILEECDNKCHVFEDGNWRSGNPTECIPGLGGCTKKLNGTIKHGPVIKEGRECIQYGEYVCEDSVTIVDTTTKTPYICTYPFMDFGGSTHGHWAQASEGDLELFPTLCTYDSYGRIFQGKNNYYICDKIRPKIFTFRKATSDELEEKCSIYNYGQYKTFKDSKAIAKCDVSESNAETQFYDWNFANDKNQGTMTDPRDSSVYKTIVMDTLTWMAENLNYADSVNYPSMRKHNWCYNNQIDSCKIHGRLYTWSAAIDSVYWSTQGITCGHTSKSKYFRCGLPERVQGICPVGWHLPNSNEWIQLLDWLEKINTEFGRSGFFTGHDGIYFSTYAHFANIHYETYFWTSTDVPSTPYDVMMLQTSPISTKLVSSESVNAISVRCVKDY